MPRRTSILVAYFIFGAYAVCAQATLLREAQVLLFGSELSWGLVLAFWLAGVGLGAAVAGRMSEKTSRPWRMFTVRGSPCRLCWPPRLPSSASRAAWWT
jgi:predicted membrane-bound spermidine synthase